MVRTPDDPWWNYVFIHALPECFKLVLEHGIDPNVVAERGYTMLHHVAHEYVRDEHRIPFAKLLLDTGASLDVRDSLLKSTPLGWACRWGAASWWSFIWSVEPIRSKRTPNRGRRRWRGQRRAGARILSNF